LLESSCHQEWHFEAGLSSRWKQSKSHQSDFALNILDAFSQMDQNEGTRKYRSAEKDEKHDFET
jgi:hypothetical protein